MRIEYLGGDDPDIAVIGGIHGDEPCGVRAIERLLDADPDVDRAVALVVANERALAAGTRYIDEDLNRVFPGDPDGKSHESRLAARIHEAIGDCTTLSMHSTQSSREAFALVKRLDEFSRRICPYLSVSAVVDVGEYDKGRLFEAAQRTIEVECGYQGSEQATENATRLTREFLGAVGVLPEESRPQRALPVYRLSKPVPKDGASTYEVYASNFEQVEAGEPFAAVDNEEVVADEGFYPVLMSPYGYENLFGYAAERVGTVEPLETTGDATDS
jgi:succinylglutamate desuccinylase